MKVGYFIFGSGSATSRLACLPLPLEDDECDLCVSSSLLDAFDSFNSAISSSISILSLRNSSRIAFMNNFGSLGSNSLRSRMKQFRASFIALVLALVIGPPIPCNGSFRVYMAEARSSSSSQGGNESIDPNGGSFYYHKDPLYLHPSDNSGVQLVTTLLTTSNYVVWCRFMKRALKSKNKLGFVDGAWITDAMTKDLAEEYAFSVSSRQLWLDLEEKYGTGDKPQAFNLKKKLVAMKQSGDSLAVYSNRLQKCWEELKCLEPKIRCTNIDNKCCATNKRLDERDSSNLVMQFLMGLYDCYDAVVSNILMIEPIPSYNKVYAMVSRIETQRGMAASKVEVAESSALAVKTSNPHKFNSSGKPNSSFAKKDVKKEDRYCNHCNKAGHVDDACFKKHGYPEWFKEYKNQIGKKSQSVSNNVTQDGNGSQASKGFDMNVFTEMIQKELQKYMKNKRAKDEKSVNTTCFADFAGNVHESYSSSAFKNGNWIIDSGASSHISGDLSLFTTLNNVNNRNTVLLPDGSEKEVKYVGEVKINNRIILKGVLYIPEFHYNLLSVHILAETGNVQFVFNNSEYIMQDLSSKECLALGRVKKHLYILNKEEVIELVTCHPSLNALNKTGLVSKMDVNDVCEIFHIEKQTRLPFGLSSINSIGPSELLHVDIWGPYSVMSLTGAKYFITLVDDNTRAVWTFLMKAKDQTVKILTNFFNYVHTQFGLVVKVVRSDNGAEFLSHDCQELFSKHDPNKKKFDSRAKCIFIGYEPSCKGYKVYDMDSRRFDYSMLDTAGTDKQEDSISFDNLQNDEVVHSDSNENDITVPANNGNTSASSSVCLTDQIQDTDIVEPIEEEIVSLDNQKVVETRKSGRVIRQPTWLKDYVT
ncbi:Integrase, catalytic core [Senna tora]|uniref:Integrase, catalytic core n=1 Tax=Senna tora TaxID=362788 RepID=A0A835C9H5_9FABA|nr:Integrase, catalytic core [Senna tora]